MAIDTTPRTTTTTTMAPGPEPAAALLVDDLVIAAAARAREPELPAATVQAALAAPIAPVPARFDVVALPQPAGAGESGDGRLAAAFATRGHRVFALQTPPSERRQPDGRFPDGHPIAVPIDLPAATARGGAASRQAALLDALDDLRQEQAIAAAVVVVRDPEWSNLVVRARERWGWRVVYDLSDPAAGDVSSPRLERAADLVAVPATIAPSAPGRRRWVAVEDSPAGWTTVDQAVRAVFPRVSIAVVTYDNLAFNRLCFASVLANTSYPNYELIVVDNGSTDGTVDDLRDLARRYPTVRLIANDRNRGFGPATNQALAVAGGEILILLNNDTIVPPGWLSRLARHLADPRLGLIGPATNRTCNEAQVASPYATYGEFVAFARQRALAYDGQRLPIRMPMMFCAALRRDVLRRVGRLDERYEIGMFEDEDYALRVKAAGYDVAWAPDVFIHHAYHASIGKLLPTGQYLSHFCANQARFEAKWGICWERHRPQPEGAGNPCS